MRIIPLGYKNATIDDRTEPEGVAIFFELEDDTLKEVSSCGDYFTRRELVERCFNDKGRNAHLYLLINGGDTKEVFKKLRWLLKEYDTVSWWSREHWKFFIKRGKK